MLIGYMRVSTGEQNLDLQRDALERAGCERIYDDVCSGRATDRPGLAKALDVARDGDALVVWKLDRIGRSLTHVVGLVSDLQKRGVGLKVLTGDVDTTTATGRLVFGIFATLAEFERDLIHERTMAGLAGGPRRGGAPGGGARGGAPACDDKAEAQSSDGDDGRPRQRCAGRSRPARGVVIDALCLHRRHRPATGTGGGTPRQTGAEGLRAGAAGLIGAGRGPYRQPNPRVRPVLRRTHTGPTRSPFPPRRHRSRVRGRAPRRPQPPRRCGPAWLAALPRDLARRACQGAGVGRALRRRPVGDHRRGRTHDGLREQRGPLAAWPPHPRALRLPRLRRLWNRVPPQSLSIWPEVTKRPSDTHKRTKQEHEARPARETKGFQRLPASLGIGDAERHSADRRKSTTHCFL